MYATTGILWQKSETSLINGLYRHKMRKTDRQMNMAFLSRVDIAMSVCPSVWTKGSQRW